MRAERKLCVGESVRGSSFHLGRNVLARQREGKQPHHTELSCTAQRELHRPRNSSSATHVSSARRAESLPGVHRPHEPPPPARQFGLSRRYRQGMAGQLFCSEACSPIGFRCTRPVRELQTQARRSPLLEARFACSPVLKIDHVLVTWERSVAGDQEGKIAALARFVVRDRRIGTPVERLEHTVTLLQPSSMVRQGMPGARTEGRSRRYFGKRWGERARFPAFEGCRRGCACTTLLRGWPR